MTSKLENKEHSMVQFTINVPKDEFKKSLQFAYKKNSKRFQVPGFRKGKVPYPVVVNYYGEAVLYEDAFEHAVDPAYKAALEEHDFKPFSSPRVDVQEIGGDKGLVFTVDVATKPEFEVKDYKGVEAYRPEVEVTAADIDVEVEKERQKVARMVPVEDGAIEDGDTANIDYAGTKDGVPFDGGTAKAYDLVIGSNSFIPGFEEGLIGKKVGEEVDLNLKFPESYHEESLAGADVVFSVKVNSVTRKELPELDDEFVKDVSEFDTLDEFRKDIEERLLKEKDASADRTFEDGILDKIVEATEIDLPDIVIKDEVESMLNEQRQQMMYQGLRLEQYLQYMGLTEDSLRFQMREPAVKRVKSRLIVDKIIELEKLDASEEEVEAEIARMAEAYSMSVEKFKESFPIENQEYIKEKVVHEKTIDFLRDNGVATDVKPEHHHEHGEACGCEACGDEHEHEADGETEAEEGKE